RGDAPPLTITEIFGFTVAQAYQAKSQLIQASDGNFYGAAAGGGDDGAGCVHGCYGTVFRLTPDGQFPLLHTFAGEAGSTPFANGRTPAGGLVEAPDGFLYGVTSTGGAPNPNRGIVYRISKDGQFQKLYDFCQTTCFDGETPVGSLVLGPDGQLYGVTNWGG